MSSLKARQRRQVWIAAWLIIFCIIGAYANALRAPFVLDDIPSIEHNLTIRQLWPLSNVLSSLRRHGDTVEGRPLLNLSFALNYAVSGRDVWSYHLANVLIHACASAILLGLVRRTLVLLSQRSAKFGALNDERCQNWFAAAAAALWALHPLQTESVTYCAQRAESLMGLFYLLTLYGFVRSVGSVRPRFWQCMSVVACGFGMATKEVMVTAPVIILLYDYTFIEGNLRKMRCARGQYYIGLLCTWILLGWLVWTAGDRGGTIGARAGIHWWQYGMSQLRALPHYIFLSFFPRTLIFDYGSSFPNVWAVLAFGLLDFAAVAATLFAVWRRSIAGFLGACFFVILSPSSSIIGGVLQMIAEHRMYLALAPVLIATLAAAYILVGRLSLVAAGGIVLAFIFGTVSRNCDYGSALALWNDNVAKRPEAYAGHVNLGTALYSRRQVEPALQQYLIAYELMPQSPEVHTCLATVLAEQGRYLAAQNECRIALSATPDDPVIHNNLAYILTRLGHPDEAVKEAHTALALRPEFPEARINLAIALGLTNEVAAGIEQLRLVTQEAPNVAAAHMGIGFAWLKLGKMADSKRELDEALRLDPNSAPTLDALGSWYMKSGETKKAIDCYASAVRLAPNSAEFECNYGLALFNDGQNETAIPHLRSAVTKEPELAAAHNGLGACYLTAGDATAAITEYRTAVRLGPDSADANRNLGVALMRTHQVSDAIESFRTVVRLEPDAAVNHLNLGGGLLEAGLPTEAMREFRQAIALSPDSSQAEYFLGIAAQAAGDAVTAEAAFRAAIQLSPGNAGAHARLALLLAMSDRNEAAAVELATATRLDPGSEETRRAAEMIGRVRR